MPRWHEPAILEILESAKLSLSCREIQILLDRETGEKVRVEVLYVDLRRLNDKGRIQKEIKHGTAVYWID
jgi:repressor of nif and glnA expression